MSNFACEHCQAIIQDSPDGFVTGCEHYPLDSQVMAPCYGKMICGQEEFSECPVKAKCGIKFAARHPEF